MISSDSENSWIILNNTHEKSKTHIIWKPKETVSISVTGVFVLYALNRKSHISKRKHQFHVQLIEFQSLKIWIQSENSAKREMNAAAAAKKKFYRDSIVQGVASAKYVTALKWSTESAILRFGLRASHTQMQ